MHSAKSALKVATETRLYAVRVLFTIAPNIGCRFQGTFFYYLTQG
jgi:hypothetical protein